MTWPVIFSVPIVPPSPNALRRAYRDRFAYRRLRMTWESYLFAALSLDARNELRSLAHRKAKMVVTIEIVHGQLYDEDNLVGSVKPVLDALVNIGVLADDSSEYLKLRVEQRQQKSAQTRIWMEPAPLSRMQA